MTSQLFLEPVLSPTHAHGGLDSPEYVRVL